MVAITNAANTDPPEDRLRPKLPMNCWTPAEMVVRWGSWMTMVGHR